MRTLHCLSCMGFLLLAACQPGPVASAAPATAEATSPDAAILPAGETTTLLNQCSRAAPAPGEGTWKPTMADVSAMLAALPAAIGASRHAHDPELANAPAGWRGQYVGIVRGGRKFVYGNYFPRRMAANDWRTVPVGVCDGGPAFFGAEFDVAAGRITQLDFNGQA